MINREKFKERYSDFDKDIVLDILDMFIANYHEKISKLSRDLNEHEPELLKQDAHAFKGIMGNIEAECSAFEQIEHLEELSQELLDAREGEDELLAETENSKFNEMIKHFVLFKNSSSQLLSEAKKLRLEYLD